MNVSFIVVHKIKRPRLKNTPPNTAVHVDFDGEIHAEINVDNYV